VYVGAAAIAAAMIVASSAAQVKAPNRNVRYAPTPAWVKAPPAATDAPTPPGAPVRVVYFDQQVRTGLRGEEIYQAYRIEILTPEALAAGNITINWAPASDEITVHRLAITRDGKPIDVLATQKFSIIQRENNLEQAMLDGNLTATLQTAGLQVGDELEFTVTRLSRDPNVGAQSQGFLQFPIVGARGAYRLRVVQPKDRAMAYRASADLPAAVVTDLGTETDRQYLLTDPASAIIPEGAPPRYGAVRQVQFSSYPDWAAVSRTFDPLFVRAAALSPSSPVKAEASRIAKETPDAARRAEAALRVVEDRIRYVYVGLDGGNYRPANADDTWRRRFGDCKAKTVLLVALLRELGIAAEPVLVGAQGGDGIDRRLPTPAVFDHVVVRATIDGAAYWLDATRSGDRHLADLDAPRSRFVLPLRSAGASLEPVAVLPPKYPQMVQVVEIDASAGFANPGKYKIQQTMRGDEILGIRAQLAGLAPADADRMQAAYWRQQMPNVEPSRTTWRFDEDKRLLVLTMEGEGKVDWEGDDKTGHTHYLLGAGFPPPAEMKHPKDQAQDAAWATDYPAFTCYATTVKVPPAGKGLHWSYSSNPVDRMLGGIAYWRISSFENGVARMAKSRRVMVPEVSAAEAATVNSAIAGFDNNKAYVSEVSGRGSGLPKLTGLADTLRNHFGTFDEFAGATPPCQGHAADRDASSTPAKDKTPS
jgi:hypothetical protein